MEKIIKTFLTLLFASSSFSQVDVVYNNLVWADEFDGNGPVNAANWHHQTQLPSGGSWFNGEVQHYTNLQANSFVDAGALHIVAKKQTYTDQGITKEYTSARLNSKFAFKYGRVDVRAKVPIGAGTWPAIWMLGRNVNEDGGYFDATYGNTPWPACGEIDIMEHGIFPSQPIDYVQSTLHTPSSNGNSVNHGGTIATDLQNTYHVYSMNWSPNQITFLLDGVAYYTYNPADKNASTWPFDAEQYVLLNIAMGGIAGGIPSNFNQATMQIDYVRVYQNTTPDTQAPLDFAGTVGNVGSDQVELLLQAEDNFGTVVYEVSYGDTTLSFNRTSGLQSVIIPDLLPSTSYTFTVTAKDLAGNQAANNPIVLNATTTADLSCAGTDNQSQQGTFAIGYNYSFETIGNNVVITFELLDTGLVGVVGILWRQSPFAEINMDQVSGNVFTKTITNQTLGATISYAVKFAYAGGLAVTKYFQYVVGSSCVLGTENPLLQQSFAFENPARDTVHIHSVSAIDKIAIYNTLGVLVGEVNHANEIPVRHLSNGVYLLVVQLGNEKSVRKLIISQ
ncbi:GH16 domain-containing protein [Flavobacterium longum]|uniref:family 16 glycosylhydrolase n=1 Tax=Flavobacterium longum TaxID=1299340 RepID=UPI0039EAA8DF